MSKEIRQRSLEFLTERGFRAASSLPLIRECTGRGIRPLHEIAARLMALDAAFTWVSLANQSVSSERIRGYIDRNSLLESMTEEERDVVGLDREAARTEHLDTIGRRLENMWALAWVLGFDPEPNLGGQLDGSIIDAMILEFLPGLEATVADLLAKSRPRSLEQVVELEDRFYCAHNSVRSAQRGASTVPPGFHPVRDGGTIHERRHSLTWCLSPGVDWDDTDLNT